MNTDLHYSTAQEPCFFERINLDEYVRAEAHNTIFLRVSGDTKEHLNIFDGDLLTVELTDKAQAGDIVVFGSASGLTLDRLVTPRPKLILIASNGIRHECSILNENKIIGVVRFILHKIGN